MFPQLTPLTQQFQKSIEEIFEERGLAHDIVGIDYSSVNIFLPLLSRTSPRPTVTNDV
jgi:hypothetical protein